MRDRPLQYPFNVSGMYVGMRIYRINYVNIMGVKWIKKKQYVEL